jgi:hypothetical protein
MSIFVVLDMHLPRLAAHLAIFDIFGDVTAIGIERDYDDLATIRTLHFRLGVNDAVAQWKFVV